MRSLYLNLDSRPDRREQAEAEFKRVGLEVERVAAISGDNRPLAFNQSVYKAMGMCGKYDELMLFEDDVVFEDGAYQAIQHVLQYPPKDGYMTIHMGCNFHGLDTTSWQKPTPYHYCSLYAVLHNCYQSHATLYSAECVEFILNNLDPNVLNEDNNIFDDWLRRKVLSQGRSYVMKPMIAYQRPSFSDIWQTDSNYVGVHKWGNEYLKKLI